MLGAFNCVYPCEHNGPFSIVSIAFIIVLFRANCVHVNCVIAFYAFSAFSAFSVFSMFNLFNVFNIFILLILFVVLVVLFALTVVITLICSRC